MLAYSQQHSISSLVAGNHSYGFQIAPAGERLVCRSVLVCESDGECVVESIDDASLVGKPMAKFLKSFIVKRSR